MRETVICAPVRTPIGRYGGVLKGLTAAQLGVAALEGLLEKSGLPGERIEDIILGHCNPSSEAPALGRVIALDAGLPFTVPGLHLDRRCGSGLQALLYAVAQVQAGQADVIVAGGVESMSNASFYSQDVRWGSHGGPVQLHDQLSRARATAGGRNYPVPGGMLETAENLRREYSITREEQDVLALESHRRATVAEEAGLFAEEIIPVTVVSRSGREVVDRDEHIRRDASFEALAGLRPILGESDPEATVTAGNSSGQNDGAAMCIVTTRQVAEQHGLRPFVRLVSSGLGGVAPHLMGIGPVPATAMALDRAGLTLDEVDLIELNEAFAAQALAVAREWAFTEGDFERTNVNGSGISLGHPVGATGVRMLTTLAHEMQRRSARYGLETMCIGGGQGLAAIFERVD